MNNNQHAEKQLRILAHALLKAHELNAPQQALDEIAATMQIIYEDAKYIKRA